ncbi:MAG: hypothetical protein EOP52_13425 [Sphingobacteriales bacterium]|nr:MAG: hypothetical protein EOP52_13425 [Sphingobacteriales bacterium]
MSCCNPSAVGAKFICGTGVELNLFADVSGTWTVKYRFTGTWLERTFSATANQKFMLPENAFMEGTTYLIELVRPNGSLFNNKTYYLQNRCNVPSDGGGGGINPAFSSTAWVDAAFGSDETGQIEHPFKPFKTIDAALEALPNIGTKKVMLSLGTHQRFTSSKVRANTIFQGSGHGIYNNTTTTTSTETVNSTFPTGFIGGTTITGGMDGLIDLPGVQICDLNIDNGSAFVAAGGIERNGVGVGLSKTFAPFQLLQGIVLRNLRILNSSPYVPWHGVVLEGCYIPILENVETYGAAHGKAIKCNGARLINCTMHQSGFDGVIFKSDSYAVCADIIMIACRIISSDPECGGIVLQDNYMGLTRILIQGCFVTGTKHAVEGYGYLGDIKIIGNQFLNIAEEGIKIANLQTSHIKDNTIRDNGAGIVIANSIDNIIKDNSPTPPIVFDPFNRPDSTIGLGSPILPVGATYTFSGDGLWGIDNGRAYVSNETSMGAIETDTVFTSATKADYTLSAICYMKSANSVGGLIVRASDANHFVLVQVSPTAIVLYRNDGGVYDTYGGSSPHNQANPLNNEIPIKVVCTGGNIKVFRNGALVIDATDTFNNNATRIGMAVTSGTDTQSGIVYGGGYRFDNLKVS